MILCQNCNAETVLSKEDALKLGWTVEEDPYQPHWYCPVCSLISKEELRLNRNTNQGKK